MYQFLLGTAIHTSPPAIFLYSFIVPQFPGGEHLVIYYIFELSTIYQATVLGIGSSALNKTNGSSYSYGAYLL